MRILEKHYKMSNASNINPILNHRSQDPRLFCSVILEPYITV